jgi:ribose/xylose/arabinose/galactoside ABC-type transport system permease subunit
MVDLPEKPQSISDRMTRMVRRLFRRENTVLIIILIILIAVTAVITKGKSVSLRNVENVLFQVSTRGIASVGQLLVILTGGIDLSVGGLATLCLVLSGILTIGLNSPPMAIGGIIPVMLLVGIGVGGINGLSVSRLGMPALIVTLAVWRITYGISLYITGVHGMIPVASPMLEVLGRLTPAVFIAVIVVAYLLLHYTTLGRSIYATGGNPMSAWLSGIKVKNILLYVYLISGFLAGLSSVLILARNMASSVQGAGALELDTIAAVCIGGVSLAGGRGSLIGVVLGVVILGVINNALNLVGVSVYMQEVVKGFLIIGAVAGDTFRKRE